MTHEDELMELLKEANDPNPKTSVETNETDSTVGVTHQYDKPDTSQEEDGSGSDVVQHSTGAWDESKKVRQGVLERALDSKGVADKADQAVMSENFKHVASGDFETHSSLLQQKSKLKVAHARTPTLMERVQKVTGRQ